MKETAMFGAGCFWGVEELYRKLPGVLSTEVGYSGGSMENPTYEEVCTGSTGHVESVKVTYDPSVVTYDELLKVFWDNHNPTTKNRQGPDVGSQYRSVIFYKTPEQKKRADASKRELEQSGKWGKAGIVTEIIPALPFYRAEEYHQQYLAKKGLSSCHI